MNEHDATEIAFKNGYEKAVREIFEEIEKCRVISSYGVCGFLIYDVHALKKKYMEDRK